MYTFTRDGGVTITCGGCGCQTPAHTSVPIKVGTPPAPCRVQTGRWNFTDDEPETRWAVFPRTRTVDGCPDCVDRIARQKRTGGHGFILDTPRKPAPRVTETYVARMPTLVKRGRA